MKVKKYIAPSMNEALMKIKQELGSDAVILNSKQIKKGGLFGLFKKTQMEVIAALDEHPIEKAKKPEQRMNEVPATKKDLQTGNAAANNQLVLEEIKQLRQLVANKSFQGNQAFAAPFDTLFQYLVEQGVHQSIAEDTVMKLQEDASENDQDHQAMIEHFLQDTFQSFVGNIPLTNKKVIQFVGPTGVGKTTTIAKVAAKMMLEQKKRVAFITTDTYRIAAIEQLKTYAKILDVPLEVVYSKDDYEATLEKFADYDHIFVDTAGRNYRETNYVNELKNMIQMAQGDCVTYLVLSLTAKSTDNDAIYQIFKEVGIHQVIFTKADETTTYGSLINLCLGEAAEIAYISNGQNVPDDLVIANAAYLTDLILSRYEYV